MKERELLPLPECQIVIVEWLFRYTVYPPAGYDPDRMPPESRPPFATYLLPTFTFPFRRRQSSASSALSVPSLSSSPTSSNSATTTPSSSPPSVYSLPIPTSNKGKQVLRETPTSKVPEAKKLQTKAQALTCTAPNTLKCLCCSSDIAYASQIVSKGFTGRHGRAYLVSPVPPTQLYPSTTSSSTPTTTSPSSPPSTASPSTSPKTTTTSLSPPLTKTKPKPTLPYKTPTDLLNTKTGRSASRELLTGLHVVADVSCIICGTVLGWKYVDAKEQSQKYKIGKFILEMKRVVLSASWEDVEGGEESWEDSLEGEEGVVVNGGEGGEGEEEVEFDSEDEDECDDLFAGVWDREIIAKRRSRRVVTRKRAEPMDA